MNVNLIAKVLIIFLGLREAVTTDLREHFASDGRLYVIEMSHETDWHTAWAICASLEYQLVEIDSDSKNDALIELLKQLKVNFNFWTGGHTAFTKDRLVVRDFFWFSTGRRLTFTFWNKDSPKLWIRNEHCIFINAYDPLYKWADFRCDIKRGYICEPQV